MKKFYEEKAFLESKLMGPNALLILEEVLQNYTIKENSTILDLGCGSGLTSIYLNDMFKSHVIALDLFTDATENYKTFQKYNLKNIIPIQADATNKIFANDFFDYIVSIDSYHYFGRDKDFIDKNISPILKKDGLIFLSFPAFKKDIHDNIPENMLKYLSIEDINCFHDMDWWSNLLSQSKTTKVLEIKELKCFDKAWSDWLSITNNPYSKEDLMAKNDVVLDYTNLISIVLSKND